MLFANRRPVAQPSNAWKQRSYPGLGSAMLGAYQAFVRMAKNLQAETQALRATFRFFEQLHQLIFPQRGDRVAAMTTCLVAQRNYNRAPVRDALDLALEDSELGRIDQIIGGVDCQKPRLNFLQIRTRIVVT